MLTNVYFVRHAETDYSNKDESLRPLTEKGRGDTALVTAFLKDKGITRAYSSPFVRAYDTIKPLCDVLGLDIAIMDGFRERRIGGWMSSEDFLNFTENQWADFDYKLPGGDSARETRARNIEALDAVLKDCAGGTVVVGSHGMALSTVMSYFDNTFGYGDYERILPLMPHIVRFTFEGDSTGGYINTTEFRLTGGE